MGIIGWVVVLPAGMVCSIHIARGDYEHASYVVEDDIKTQGLAEIGDSPISRDAGVLPILLLIVLRVSTH